MIGLSKEAKAQAKRSKRFTFQFKLDGRNVPTLNIHGDPSFHSCLEYSCTLSKEQGEEFQAMWLRWLKQDSAESDSKS
jgi:predicted 3-demethylubiquinone-9 3-methyltransferase (glyoxalase superfamily)